MASRGRSLQTLLEKLVIPGPVIQGHVKLEKDCGKCHEPFSRQSQTRLCLDCHKETAANRESKTGFHGLCPDALKQECRHCHTDHKGRDAKSISSTGKLSITALRTLSSMMRTKWSLARAATCPK